MNSPFLVLALQRKTPREAAALVGCDLGTAKRALSQAYFSLRQRQENIRNAVEVTLADNIVRQDVSRRSWEDVALGLKRAA